MATVITVPHPTLRQVAREIDTTIPHLEALLQDLGETLRAQDNPPGVGLALPQIDQALRGFATYLETSQSEEPSLRFFLNPRIIDRSEKLTLGPNPRNPDLEGCLSIPLLYAPVWRSEWITLEWEEILNNNITHIHHETFFDFAARVMQHELDHLNGVLFIDHVREQGQPLYRTEGKKLVETDPLILEALG